MLITVATDKIASLMVEQALAKGWNIDEINPTVKANIEQEIKRRRAQFETESEQYIDEVAELIDVITEIEERNTAYSSCYRKGGYHLTKLLKA